MILSYRRLSEGKIIFLVVVFSLFVRFLTVCILKIDPASDYLAYDQMARNLIAHGIMKDDFGNVAFYSGGYPLFFLTPIYALFGHSPLLAQLGNALLGGLTTYLIYLLLQQAKAGSIARVAGPLMFAMYVPSWLYCEYLAKENLMTPLILLLLYTSARLNTKPSIFSAIAAGATVAALAITGSAGLALLPITIIAIIFARAQIRTKVQVGSVFLFAALIMVSPWQYRNAELLGSPVINTNGGFNLYLGNNANADGFFVSIAATPLGSRWKDIRAKGEVYASDQLKIEAIKWITENPVKFAQLAVKKAVIFWTPPLHEGKGTVSKMEKVTRLVWLFQYLILCIPAVYVLATIKRRNRFVIGVASAIVLYSSVHMLFYVIFRYREPIMPLLIILAAIGIESLVYKFTRPQNCSEVWHSPETDDKAKAFA